MAYRPEEPEDQPDEPDAALADWVARHLATAPPFTRDQRARIAYRLANQGATR